MSRAFLFALVCFAVVYSVSAAGFSAELTEPGGVAALSNGANSLTLSGGSWSTSGSGGFTDGQFQADGGYIIPNNGVFHFDGSIQVSVTTASAPNAEVDIRIVKCGAGCNALCTGGTNVAGTLLVDNVLYLGDGFTNAAPPTYSLRISFTGSFNTGDIIGLCVDNLGSSGAVQLVCPTNEVSCVFSGFGI